LLVAFQKLQILFRILAHTANHQVLALEGIIKEMIQQAETLDLTCPADVNPGTGTSVQMAADGHMHIIMVRDIQILTDQILDVVDKQPEKKPKIRQLINYYLPTVIKLLRQYLLLQEQEVAGGNIEASKEKICKMLMDINSALKKQLDNMFEADLVDITAEIRVMEKKLAAEGLTEDMN